MGRNSDADALRRRHGTEGDLRGEMTDTRPRRRMMIVGRHQETGSAGTIPRMDVRPRRPLPMGKDMGDDPAYPV
ncbi:hypothetical protein QE368_000284 [Asaia bogorensis NBRC 16594]|nr:hypothetical protein [Asaia bogorensis NBRC 16594]